MESTIAATFGWLGVETTIVMPDDIKVVVQPPPRGCVLKRPLTGEPNHQPNAAASARLCVETKKISQNLTPLRQPPKRGCVLKPAVCEMI